ncbi:sensor domain-containing protein [Planomonospora sp. ID67723]|uniref:sensor histidine kinase n=1 Tax=Planomonospora sp. ID67723 TaxID=2738134 RepID=UPI0018C41127|nr:sensor histidine kinase [Planomonospora sp. ID67723]MBG0831726.1 sensor domain-containing protein [Planomonospora sp. ID67723]
MKSLLRRIGADTRYLFVGFPLAVVVFALVVTGFAAGAGTVAVWVGAPILAATLTLARSVADLQRTILAGVLGHPVARPRYRRAPESAGWFRRMVNPLTSGQSWLDLLHAIVNFPIAVVTFCFTVTWWAGTIVGLTFPLYGWLTASMPDNYGPAYLLGFGDSTVIDVLITTGVGLLFAITLPVVIRGGALIQAGLSRAMLTGVAELHERIDDLAEGRAAAVSAEANALRKLERDIHDGPQQRLVSLAMDLSRAQRQLKRDPQAVEQMLSQAITSTRETLDELRALSRGIAPPILTDRGLAPALAALASRCTVPVELDVQVEGRFAAAVENTVYFVVAESLTNIAKHSHASVCTVTLAKTGGVLMLTIGDDGVGGAHVAKGHGLSGLADRLRAADGELSVDSPVGGPTVIVAEVPCG